MRDLKTLVATLEHQNERKRDLVIPSSKIKMLNPNRFEVEMQGASEYMNPNDLFERQISNKLGIPFKYYQAMKSNRPELLVENVNSWLDFNHSKNYLVRSFLQEEHNLLGRAFLSDRYNIIDNYDVLFASLKAIQESGLHVEIKSCDVTENKLYIHVTCPQIEIDAHDILKNYLKENDGLGNGIVSGFVITNSEVGTGSFEIRPRAVIIKCNNGLIGEQSIRRVHLGTTLENGEITWSENTKRANMQLVISQTQDAIRTYLSKDYLTGMVEDLYKLKELELKNPIDAVQHISKHLSIPDKEKYDILSCFMNDGDMSGLGVFSAFTRGGQNLDSDMLDEVESNIVTILNNRKLMTKFDTPFN